MNSSHPRALSSAPGPLAQGKRGLPSQQGENVQDTRESQAAHRQKKETRLSVDPLRRLAWSCWRCDFQAGQNDDEEWASSSAPATSPAAAAGTAGSSALPEQPRKHSEGGGSGGASNTVRQQQQQQQPASAASPSGGGTNTEEWVVRLDVHESAVRHQAAVGGGWFAVGTATVGIWNKVRQGIGGSSGWRGWRWPWGRRRRSTSARQHRQQQQQEQQQQQLGGDNNNSGNGNGSDSSSAGGGGDDAAGTWSESEVGAAAAATWAAAGPASAGPSVVRATTGAAAATAKTKVPTRWATTPAAPAPLGNRVVTAKYSLLTFPPIFLFEVFSRVAYLYFLAQAALSWWDVVSPFSGIGSTAALLFVVAVSGVKSAVEDVRRHLEDRATNRALTRRLLPDGSTKRIAWEDVRVGDVLEVRDGELLPADLLLLRTGLPEGVAFVRTTNLDGETNLKVRHAVRLPGWEQYDNTIVEDAEAEAEVNVPDGDAGGNANNDNGNGNGSSSSGSSSSSSDGAARSDASVELRRSNHQLLAGVTGRVVCEQPSRSLHSFTGGLHLDPPSPPFESRLVPPLQEESQGELQGESQGEPTSSVPQQQQTAAAAAVAAGAAAPQPPAAVPLSMDNMLLRGCVLKNSRYVLGLAVYCGPQTRIQMNAVRPPIKVGSFDRFLNKQILLLLVLQLLLSVASAVVSWVWRKYEGVRRPHLALDDPVQGNWRSPGTYIVLLSITFWILYGYLVPISLFVTMELVKFWQAFVFINSDPALEDPASSCQPSSNGHHKHHRHEQHIDRPQGGFRSLFTSTREPDNNNNNHNSVAREAASGDAWGDAGHDRRRGDHRNAGVGSDNGGGGDGSGAEDGSSNGGSGSNGSAGGGSGNGGSGHAFARSSAVNEDLGRVAMVFSDKTGTLTRNDMRLRCCALGEERFGSLDVRLEERPELVGPSALREFDSRLLQAAIALVRAGRWRQVVEGGGAGGFAAAASTSAAAAGSAAGAAAGSALQQQKQQQNQATQDEPERKQQEQEREVLGQRLVSFWLGVCLCHSVVLEPHPAADKPPAYQGPSPDEVALLDAARQLGFELTARRRDELELKVMSPPASEVPSAEPSAAVSPSASATPGSVPSAAPAELEGSSGGSGGRGGGGGESSGERSGVADVSGGIGAATAADAAAKDNDGNALVVRYRVLNVLEFSSARKRMSVVVEAPDGSLALHTKGADSVILSRLAVAGGGGTSVAAAGAAGSSEAVRAAAEASLQHFATQGLRTLVLAARPLPDRAWYERWDERYQAAAAGVGAGGTDPRVRAAALDALAEEMERELQLVGVAAIEDQLQEGVPAAVATLLAAGVRVWMITGDKLETAVNIARAARLVTQPRDEQLLVLREVGEAAIRQQLRSLTRRAAAIIAAAATNDTSGGGSGGGGGSNRGSSGVGGGMGRRVSGQRQRRVTARANADVGGGGAAAAGGTNRRTSDGASAVSDQQQQRNKGLAADQQWRHGQQGHEAGDVTLDQQHKQQRQQQQQQQQRQRSKETKELQLSSTASAAAAAATATARPADGDDGSGDVASDGGFPSTTAELVVDSRTLDMILDRPSLVRQLAALCAGCASVVVCRASPAQKAALVRMMREHRRRTAEARRRRRWRWLAGFGGSGGGGGRGVSVAPVMWLLTRLGFRKEGTAAEAAPRVGHVRASGSHDGGGGGGDHEGSSVVLGDGGDGGEWGSMERDGVLLAIGDGANDVAMIQAADVGIGVMGKEGRQAVNNSDVALPLFRHLVPLLLVHGTLSNERLSRLITYSFYKNLAYWGMLLAFQFYCGFSGADRRHQRLLLQRGLHRGSHSGGGAAGESGPRPRPHAAAAPGALQLPLAAHRPEVLAGGNPAAADPQRRLFLRTHVRSHAVRHTAVTQPVRGWQGVVRFVGGCRYC
ncbi:hypothetical protein Agub_g8931 [Astrephomene gubernaculifera]|uniref:P-type phospholipid transporter n=1 Tax=Astrephomene gubernaculifera TaxID=47775 RepID=A0AAD3DSK2_9CHLO|nr:hypothetical protein Agub_g8931 [Astrephomene gubernaculifera]